MSLIKNAIAEIENCDFCFGLGYLGYFSPDGDYDYDFCDCNPYKIPPSELEG